MKFFLLSMILFLSANLRAQVSSFTLTNVVNGKSVSLSDYNNSKGIVIIFVSNTCPFDQYYESRINALSDTGLPVLLVNADQSQAENEQTMKAKATGAGWPFPYLADKQQVLAESLGATKTPEAFLLKRDGKNFTTVYSGVIDDNPQVATDVGNAYLSDAIEAMLAGRSIETSQTRPVGCSLRTGR